MWTTRLTARSVRPTAIAGMQDWGYEYGAIGKELRRPKIVRPAERSPAIDIDRDRCIVCGRCVRACDEQIGAVALALSARHRDGDDAAFGKSLMDTPCVECGQCVEVCPVGALSSGLPMHPVHHWQQRKTRTTCQLLRGLHDAGGRAQ